MQTILDKVYKLLELHKKGLLGGEVMPEDIHPNLSIETNENYLYFTLPMALNYQRNSYKLWEAANNSYFDKETQDIFNPLEVIHMDLGNLQKKMLKHKLALQPNKHPEIWKTISTTIMNDFNGDLRNLFNKNDNDVKKIKEYILSHKKDFPYLGGTKIMNYWLYVIEQYTDRKLKNRQYISVAPDTHVVQASVKLGLVSERDISKNNFREELAFKWQDLLKNQDICPIDIHTPLWLWSRNGFKEIV